MALRFADIAEALDIVAHRLGELEGQHRNDAEFNESDHPRAADGKFSTSASSSSKEYHEGLKGKKGTTAGLIRHLLLKGHAEEDIHAEAAHHYGLGDDKKHYTKWYHADLRKKGVDVPDLKKTKSNGEPSAPAPAATGPAPSPAPSSEKAPEPKGVEVTPKAPTGSPQYNPATTATASGENQTPPLPSSIASLKKVGAQLGSNPGGQYANEAGEKFYVKHSKSAAHAANEVLAGHLYHAAGAPITQAHKIDAGGKPGTISKWEKHEEAFDPKNQDHVREAQQHFATHAWLGNWDAIGLENDNQVRINGKLHTVDAGGALKYRAQGGDKGAAFGPEVQELKTMRNAAKSKQAAHVFGSMSNADLKKSAERVKAVPDDTIHALVHEHGHGSDAEKTAFADLLIARKNDLISKTGD